MRVTGECEAAPQREARPEDHASFESLHATPSATEAWHSTRKQITCEAVCHVGCALGELAQQHAHDALARVPRHPVVVVHNTQQHQRVHYNQVRVGSHGRARPCASTAQAPSGLTPLQRCMKNIGLALSAAFGTQCVQNHHADSGIPHSSKCTCRGRCSKDPAQLPQRIGFQPRSFESAMVVIRCVLKAARAVSQALAKLQTGGLAGQSALCDARRPMHTICTAAETACDTPVSLAGVHVVLARQLMQQFVMQRTHFDICCMPGDWSSVSALRCTAGKLQLAHQTTLLRCSRLLVAVDISGVLCNAHMLRRLMLQSAGAHLPSVLRQSWTRQVSCTSRNLTVTERACVDIPYLLERNDMSRCCCC